MSAYQRDKEKQNYKFKAERTDFQRSLSDLLKKLEISNYLLALIFMTLFGIFIRMIIG